MTGRFISAVALYGPKADPVRDFLINVQALIRERVGDSFRPYSLEQIHATLIALNGVPDPESGTIVNEYLLEHTGAGLGMDLPRAMSLLAAHLTPALQVRIGGHSPDQAVPFTSRGQHLYERAFSVQGNAFVLVGWPVMALTGPGRPLDKLRRDMNAANVLHRYHRRRADLAARCYPVARPHPRAPAAHLAPPPLARSGTPRPAPPCLRPRPPGRPSPPHLPATRARPD